MTENHSATNEELNRALLADGIARLEKQLSAAEKRAREAEASAKEAKSALAEVLLDKARSQKSAPASSTSQTSQDEREIRSLRTELEAARHDLQQQQATIQDARDDAAEDLRLEYERRFRAARERMAHEFQKRLEDAEAALVLNAKRQTAEEIPERSETDDSPGLKAPDSPITEKKLAAAPLLGALGARSIEHMRRYAYAVPLAAFTGGLILGWFALPGRSEPDPVITQASSPPVESAVPTAPAKETASIETGITPDRTQLSSPTPSSVETPPPEPIKQLTPRVPVMDVAEPAGPQETRPVPVDGADVLQEHNAALSTEIEKLRGELETTSKHVKSVEAALSAERRKSAALTRRAAAAEHAREEQARAASAAKRQRLPGPGAPHTQERPGALMNFLRIE